MSHPCNCQPSGNGWNTPTPGNLTVIPPGSTVVQTPVAYSCHTEQATGTPVGATTPPATQTPADTYPMLSAAVTMPIIGSAGQLRATNASLWAISGMSLWLPPFGNVKVTGVSGDLVTFENLSIPAGSTLQSGSVVVPSGPAVEDVDAVEAVTQFDHILGLVDGVEKKIEADAGDVLRFNNGKWVKYQLGASFYPVNQSVGSESGSGATRYVANGNEVTPYDVVLPLKPAAFGGRQIFALVESGGKPRTTGAQLRILANGIVIHFNGTDNDGNTLAMINVTNQTAVPVRIYRHTGTGNVDGWFNILGYYA